MNNYSTSQEPRYPKYNKPHLIISQEDWEWSFEQKPFVNTLWRECWKCDPYGNRWMNLTTSLSTSRFFAAKKILLESGLFEFKPDKSTADNRKTTSWLVRNLHGSRIQSYWKESKTTLHMDRLNETIGDDLSPNGESISCENLTQQVSCNLSVTIQETKQEILIQDQDPIGYANEEIEPLKKDLGLSGAKAQESSTVRNINKPDPMGHCETLSVLDPDNQQDNNLLGILDQPTMDQAHTRVGVHTSAHVGTHESEGLQENNSLIEQTSCALAPECSEMDGNNENDQMYQGDNQGTFVPILEANGETLELDINPVPQEDAYKLFYELGVESLATSALLAEIKASEGMFFDASEVNQLVENTMKNISAFIPKDCFSSIFSLLVKYTGSVVFKEVSTGTSIYVVRKVEIRSLVNA